MPPLLDRKGEEGQEEGRWRWGPVVSPTVLFALCPLGGLRVAQLFAPFDWTGELKHHLRASANGWKRGRGEVG